METIERIVRAITEQEYVIGFSPSLFGGLSEEEYLAEFSQSLWPVDSLDDVAKYAAR